MMERKASWGVVTSMMICALAIAVWACQAQEKTSAPRPEPGTAAEHEVTIVIDEKVPDFAAEKLPTIRVKRGERVQFNATNSDLWILIPRGFILEESGGSEWALAKSFISFMIAEGEYATIRIAKDFPDSEREQEFAYSVLSRTGAQWRYVLGNSPPRMIIPP